MLGDDGMAAHANDRIAYCSGRIMPEREVLLSFRDGEQATEDGPTVIVECTPLPFQPARASLCRRNPRGRAKHATDTLNMIIADQEATSVDPNAWAMLLDIHGNLAEGRGSNIFLVREGRLATPRARYVLPGISRQTVLELAAELGIPCDETDLDLYDAYNADEAFLTSTSLCICPVHSINGSRIGSEQVFGTITRRLIEAYVRLVDCDFVEQCCRRLG